MLSTVAGLGVGVSGKASYGFELVFCEAVSTEVGVSFVCAVTVIISVEVLDQHKLLLPRLIH